MIDLSTGAQPGGVRMRYADAPRGVRDWVERELGSAVRAVVDCSGGFSPGPAARVTCASGRRAFVKAVGAELNADTPGMLRREVDALAAVPTHPSIPRVYATYDDGDWVALLLEDVPGAPPRRPWTLEGIQRVADTIVSLQEVLDPCPWADAPLAGEQARPFFDRWRLLVADPPLDLDPWWRVHLDELGGLASEAADVVDGVQLVHWDVRSDNVLLDGRRTVLVDWGQARRGAAWMDPLLVTIDAVLSGADLDPDTVRSRLPLVRDAEHHDVARVVCAAAMAWRHTSRSTDVGLPSLRPWQRRWADSLTGWLRELV
ncbi:MAG TPA: aminoglycoside phosphotransferase family protein [Nocardioidaceae bacterium]|nr:aminoglycoside phosphotransferase family protein [Nocardioidaceae bacterium]